MVQFRSLLLQMSISGPVVLRHTKYLMIPMFVFLATSLQLYVVSASTMFMCRPEVLQWIWFVLMFMTCDTTKGQVDALRLGCYLKSWVLLTYGAILIWVNFTITRDKGDVRNRAVPDGYFWVHGPTALMSMLISIAHVRTENLGIFMVWTAAWNQVYIHGLCLLRTPCLCL